LLPSQLCPLVSGAMDSDGWVGSSGGGGGGGAGKYDGDCGGADAAATQTDAAAPMPEEEDDELFLRQNLALWCFRIGKWRWYMSRSVNRYIADLLISEKTRNNVEQKTANKLEDALSKRAAKEGIVVCFDLLSGLRAAVLPCISRHATVAKTKERFMVRALAKAKAEKRRLNNFHLTALRFFVGNDELKDSKTLSEQGVRNASVIMVVLASADRDNLEALFDATEGPYWGKSKHRHGWRYPCDIREWAGVTVDPSGDYVVYLRRNRLNMKGARVMLSSSCLCCVCALRRSA
jgi:hypothetical protein